MALMDFIRKQFIDIIQWTESSDGTLAWRFPMAGMEIQNGASLTVRESQVAIFVNEGQVADVFGPGMYKLTTQTLPVLTYLKNWDKLFESPFKSDVYFFSTRQQIDQKWGTPQPITVRDKDFGAVRLRAFGNYAFRVADPKAFHTEISGTRDIYSVADLDGQLRGLVLQNISNAIASSGLPFLDLAANQIMFADALAQQIRPDSARSAQTIKPGHPLPFESDQTTHYSVVDKAGNAVAVTYTLNTNFGSGIVAKGTGVLLNNEMDDFSVKPGVANAYGLVGGDANAVAAKKRPLSSMTPTLVLKDGKPTLVTGSPGGARIITTVLQTVVNTIDFGNNPAEAAAAPRVHHQWTPDELRVEKGLSPDTLALLKQRGHNIAVKPSMGRTQTIQIRNGMLYGYSDPRNPDGQTLGY